MNARRALIHAWSKTADWPFALVDADNRVRALSTKASALVVGNGLRLVAISPALRAVELGDTVDAGFLVETPR